MGIENIRTLQKGVARVQALPDNIANLVRVLSKNTDTFTGVAGGGKQQVDRVGIILSHILGGQANRNAIKQAWRQLPRETQGKVLKEIGNKYPVAGQPTQMTPEGQFIRDYLTGRADLSPEQLRSIAAAEEAAETGAKINPTRGGSATFDSNSGTMTDGTETHDLDGGLDGANTLDIDPDLAVPPTPTSTTAQNPYSNLRKSLAEQGIIRNKFDTKTPLRVESETNLAPGMVDGEQRMIPVTTTKGGQADRTLTGQTSRAEKGNSVDAATDFQTSAGNSNPQAMYDDRLVRLADGGGGTAEDLWSTLAGPNAASTLRFNFESPREAAEAMVSMMTADIGAARTGGGISAGQIQELTQGRLYEGFDEASARTIAQDMGLETSGMGQSRKGLESIIEDLERVITREVGGSGWGAEARAAAESAGGAGLPPVPKEQQQLNQLAGAVARTADQPELQTVNGLNSVPKPAPESPSLAGKTFAPGGSLGDPVPNFENGVKRGGSSSSSAPADDLPEVPKKTKSLEAAMGTVELERARSESWNRQASGIAESLGLPPEAAELSPRMIEAQINVLRQSNTPEAAREIKSLEALLPNAKRIAAQVEGPYGTKSKVLRYGPKPRKIYHNPIVGINSATTPKELDQWSKHVRDNKDIYIDQLGEQGYQNVLAAGAKKRIQLGGGSPLGDKVKAKKKPQPQPSESQPSDLDNAMPEGDPITPEPEVVTPDGNTPPKVEPEFAQETIDPYTHGRPAPEQPMRGETVGNDYKNGTKTGRTRRGRVVDEKPAAGDGGGKKPPEDPPKNNRGNNGDDDWERDYSDPSSKKKKKGKKNKKDKTPSNTETDPPPTPEGQEGKGYWKYVGNRWVWIAGAGALAAFMLNKAGDPDAPIDDVAAFPGGGGNEEISPEVMAMAEKAMGGEGEGPEELSLIQKLRKQKKERLQRSQALKVNPNVQTNASWRR